MHASSDCDVLRYSQPRARTLCKRCVKKEWVVSADFLGEEKFTRESTPSVRGEVFRVFRVLGFQVLSRP